MGAEGMTAGALVWTPRYAKRQLCALLNACAEGPRRELLRPEAWAHATAVLKEKTSRPEPFSDFREIGAAATLQKLFMKCHMAVIEPHLQLPEGVIVAGGLRGYNAVGIQTRLRCLVALGRDWGPSYPSQSRP